MFDDIGKKIKWLTKIIVWIGIGASILAGLTMFILAFIADDDEVGLFILLGFACIIIGPFLSWISGFFMYGFGELIDKTCDIQKEVCVKKSLRPQNNVHHQNMHIANTATRSHVSSNYSHYNSAQTVPLPSGTIRCPVCKLIQPNDRITCWQCGAKLKND